MFIKEYCGEYVQIFVTDEKIIIKKIINDNYGNIIKKKEYDFVIKNYKEFNNLSEYFMKTLDIKCEIDEIYESYYNLVLKIC